MAKIGDAQNSRRGLLVDEHLRLLGAEGVFALGDCTGSSLPSFDARTAELTGPSSQPPTTRPPRRPLPSRASTSPVSSSSSRRRTSSSRSSRLPRRPTPSRRASTRSQTPSSALRPSAPSTTLFVFSVDGFYLPDLSADLVFPPAPRRKRSQSYRLRREPRLTFPRSPVPRLHRIRQGHRRPSPHERKPRRRRFRHLLVRSQSGL